MRISVNAHRAVPQPAALMRVSIYFKEVISYV